MTAETMVMPPRSMAAQRPLPELGLFSQVAIYTLVTLLITVRFFTERIAILPRVFNAGDLIIVAALVPFLLVVRLVRPMPLRARIVVRLAMFTIFGWAVAWLANYGIVHWLGALLFISQLLAPILLFVVIVNLPLPQRFPRQMTRWLLFLLTVNLIVAGIDAAAGYGRMLNDFVFGTFGVNQNQLAFFLAVMMSLLLARWRCGRLPMRGKLVLAVTASLFILCGFQTLWVVFSVAMVAVHVAVARIDRRVILMLIAATALAAGVLTTFRFERFDVITMLEQAAEHTDELGKVQLLRDTASIIEQRPAVLLWGVGPGSFNSRAFRNIAIIPYGTYAATDVAAAIVTPFYTSPLANKYIIPYFEHGPTYLTGNTDAPFTSYVSIPIESGLLGAVPLFAIYIGFGLALMRDVRRCAHPQVRVDAMWALSCLLLLAGVSVIDNYLETTRDTMLVWLPVAIWYVRRRTLLGKVSD